MRGSSGTEKTRKSTVVDGPHQQRCKKDVRTGSKQIVCVEAAGAEILYEEYVGKMEDIMKHLDRAGLRANLKPMVLDGRKIVNWHDGGIDIYALFWNSILYPYAMD